LLAWLSSRLLELLTFSSVSSLFNHVASYALDESAMYSDSVLDLETISCRLLDHEIAPFARLKRYPLVDFLVSSQAAQSASVYP
jgi:hypothetical protein